MPSHRTVVCPSKIVLAALWWAPGAALAADGRVPIYQQVPSATTIITQSGSYYLTENLSHTGTVIDIQASNVTIDLEEHTIWSSSTTNDLVVATDVNNIRITNGKMYLGSRAINFKRTVSGAGFIQVDNLQVGYEGDEGIHIEGTSSGPVDAIVSNVTVNQPTVAGINLIYGSDGRLSNNLVFGTTSLTGAGISCDSCVKMTIANNTTSGCANIGIRISGGSGSDMVAGNVSAGNGGVGIYVLGNNHAINGNNVSQNGAYGIQIAGGNHRVTENTVSGSLNNSDGILISTGATSITVESNTTSGNTGSGIRIAGTTVVPTYNISLRGNTCNGNTTAGIRLGQGGLTGSTVSYCAIVGNTCSGNAVGIDVSGDACNQNVIEQNVCSNSSGTGIRIQGGSSLNQVMHNRTPASSGTATNQKNCYSELLSPPTNNVGGISDGGTSTIVCGNKS